MTTIAGARASGRFSKTPMRARSGIGPGGVTS
jgi:hypothetical protein